MATSPQKTSRYISREEFSTLSALHRIRKCSAPTQPHPHVYVKLIQHSPNYTGCTVSAQERLPSCPWHPPCGPEIQDLSSTPLTITCTLKTKHVCAVLHQLQLQHLAGQKIIHHHVSY
jgi:hypothetical protein